MTANVPIPPPSNPAPSLRPVEELQALCDRATSDPWFAANREGDEESWWIWATDEDGDPFPVALMAYEGPDVDTDGEREEADADFIAAARDALPALLARLRAAEETLAAVGALADAIDEEYATRCCNRGPRQPCRDECLRIANVLDRFRAALAEGASR